MRNVARTALHSRRPNKCNLQKERAKTQTKTTRTHKTVLRCHKEERRPLPVVVASDRVSASDLHFELQIGMTGFGLKASPSGPAGPLR